MSTKKTTNIPDSIKMQHLNTNKWLFQRFKQ